MSGRAERTLEERKTSTREMLRNALWTGARADLSTDQRLMIISVALNADDFGVAFPTPRHLADMVFRRSDARAITKAEKLLRGLASIEAAAFVGQGRKEPHPPRSALIFYAEPRNVGLPSPKAWTDPRTKRRYEPGQVMPDDHWIIAVPSAAVSPEAFHRYASLHRTVERRFSFVGEGFEAWADWIPPSRRAANDDDGSLAVKPSVFPGLAAR